MSSMEIPFVDGPLAGTTERHDGVGPPRPGVTADGPIDFGDVTPIGDDNALRLSATRTTWLYVLAERDTEPGWEYRLADPGSAFSRQFYAEQRQILDTVMTSAYANIERQAQPVKVNAGRLADEMQREFGYVTDGELADPRKKWPRP